MKLKEDWALFKPTIIAIVPRLLTRIYAAVKKTFEDLKGVKKMLAEKGLASKLKTIR